MVSSRHQKHSTLITIWGRNDERKCNAWFFGAVINPDSAAVGFYDFPRDRQSQAGTGDVRTVQPAKGDEQPIVVLSRNTDAIVCDGEKPSFRHSTCSKLDGWRIGASKFK
jgi:hypothetical protein